MVRFLNLDDPSQALAAQSLTNSYNPYLTGHGLPGPSEIECSQFHNESEEANRAPIGLDAEKGNIIESKDCEITSNGGSFAKVLASYPCIRAIVNDLDQNDLYNLSMTCKQFRANLLENRKHLLSFTMRCKYSNLLSNRPAVQNRILKVSNFNCVTDLVFRCLDCNEPVCRNCKAKVQASNRLGQMCTTCRTIPLSELAEDPRNFLCKCRVEKGESWACKPCALRRKHQYTIRGRTWDKIRELDSTDITMEEYYEFQCTRGLECCGNGWEKCSSQDGLEIRPRGSEFVPILPDKDRESLKYRALCLWCGGFVLPPFEENLYRKLTS